MTKIKHFVVICENCKEKSMVNMEFLGKKTFMFKCYHCNATEVVVALGLPPVDEEDFINQSEIRNLDKQVN